MNKKVNGKYFAFFSCFFLFFCATVPKTFHLYVKYLVSFFVLDILLPIITSMHALLEIQTVFQIGNSIELNFFLTLLFHENENCGKRCSITIYLHHHHSRSPPLFRSFHSSLFLVDACASVETFLTKEILRNKVML